MDFQALKDSIRNVEIINKPTVDKKKELYDEVNGYYSIPNTKEPFHGDVIELSGDEFNVYFQKFGQGMSEYQFRDRLESMDIWLSDKPYNVTKNWMSYIPKWLMKCTK